MNERDTQVITTTFPARQGEQVLLVDHEQATSYQQTQANLAGQLSERSQRIYQSDVDAFLWWLRGYLAGASQGRYKDYAPQAQPCSPAEAASLLSQLTRDQVIAYRAYLDAKDPTDPQGQRRLYAKTTAIRRLTVVRRLCAEAVFKGLLAENPTEGIRGLRNAAPEETPHQALTIEQLRALINAIGTCTLKDLRDKALLMVLARLGLRREEAAQLNWSDLHERQGHMVFHIRHGKGDRAGIAKVPVDVARLLEEYRAALGEATTPVFVALHKGSHLRRNAHGQAVRLNAKGIEGVTLERGLRAIPPGQPAMPPFAHLTPHDLRATFITLALEGKAPLQVVQYAARHKDPRMTEHYQRRKVNLDDNAVDYIHF